MGAGMQNSQESNRGRDLRSVEAEIVANEIVDIDLQTASLTEARESLISDEERRQIRDELRVVELQELGSTPPTVQETRELQALVTSTVDSYDRVMQESLRLGDAWGASPWKAYVGKLEEVYEQTQDVRDRMLLADAISTEDAKGFRQLMSEVEKTLEQAKISYEAAINNEEEYMNNPRADW